MEFEDKLRALFAKADASIVDERLNHHEVVGRGRRLRTMRFATVGVAAALVVAGGVFMSLGELPIGGDRPGEIGGPTNPPMTGSLEEGFIFPPPPPVGTDCSAHPASTVGAQQELPPPVREMRKKIIEAAWACDFDRLEELANQGETRFVAVVGGGASVRENAADLSEYWRELDASGEPHFAVTKLMVRLLETEPAVVDDGSGTYVWPAAVITRDPTDYKALETVYEPSVARDMRRSGTYWGYRIQIDPEGDWNGFLLEPEQPGGGAASNLASFSPGGTSDECSGAMDAHTGYEQPGLPDAVNEVRRDIITRTWTCDYESLEEIALFHEQSPFEFGDNSVDGRPGEYWRRREEAGEPVLAALVEALESDSTHLDHTRGGKVDIYIWTTNGYRVEITSEGDWTVFVPAE